MYMKKQSIFKCILWALLGCMALASCEKDHVDTGGAEVTGSGDITFEIGFAPATRVATDADFDSAWEDGDQIGLFAVAHGTSLSANSDNPINNVRLTYSGGSWSGEAYWPAEGGNLDFYAYYPYDVAAIDPTNITFNVMADQSAATDGRPNYNLSDLLTAKAAKTGGYGKGEIVSLQFAHALSLVQVEVDNTNGSIDHNEAVIVTLHGVKTKSTLNLGGASGPEVSLAAADNEPASIKMYRVEQPSDANYRTKYTYRALVPAQTLAGNNSICRIVNGEFLFDGQKLASDLALVPGKAELYSQTLPSVIHTVAIPAGTFLMGSSDGSNQDNNDSTGLNTTPAEPGRAIYSEPQHKVMLTKDFRMSRYPITNVQYAAFLNANSIGSDGVWALGNYPAKKLIEASSGNADWGLHWETDKWVPAVGYENHPVVYVTWHGADEYARWIGGSLPTEAQWEYACRGGQTESLPFGIGDGTMLYAEMANFNGTFPYQLPNGGITSFNGSSEHPNTYLGKTTAVGIYPYANGYGLYDMHGNVFEWCSDVHEMKYGLSDLTQTAVDPTGREPSPAYPNRTVRGGAWDQAASATRSAFRLGGTPEAAISYLGFRVVFVQ